ncbi:hypothetical protein [Tahibacter sp.]|uniref:hypothetical protein n=1 Tax=Tahibacter sp. TaxID=2056211 RepID=UPI0028C39D70|nr:hypothetical protein [Tahibacter sp.]
MNTRAPDWVGELLVGRGWARFVGRVGGEPSQACSSVRLVGAVCCWNRLTIHNAEPRRFAGAVVANRVAVSIGPERDYAVVLFVDARLPVGRALTPLREAAWSPLSAPRAKAWRRAIYGLSASSNLDEVAELLTDRSRSLPGARTQAILKSWEHLTTALEARRRHRAEAAGSGADFSMPRHDDRVFQRLLGLPASRIHGYR